MNTATWPNRTRFVPNVVSLEVIVRVARFVNTNSSTSSLKYCY